MDLKDPKLYTGHCYRPTGASLLAESGADFAQVKQLGGWMSDKVCYGYIENSMRNRQKIFGRLTSGADPINPPSNKNDANQFVPKPSTSKDTSTSLIFESSSRKNVQKISSENRENINEFSSLHWEDFSTEMLVPDNNDTAYSRHTGNMSPTFVTANNKSIDITDKSLIRATSNSSINRNQRFFSKPAVKVFFNRDNVESPGKKFKNSSKITNPLDYEVQQNGKENEILISNQEFNDKHTLFKNSVVKYDSCTFNGNVINYYYSCKNCKE
uniref:Tyr recombinase domain-containing protein n=1 Tax=Trichogramma kaykai TaxID=54128 RepID=A0ABD2W2N0_9HYME